MRNLICTVSLACAVAMPAWGQTPMNKNTGDAETPQESAPMQKAAPQMKLPASKIAPKVPLSDGDGSM